jgi:hypothetical protein
MATTMDGLVMDILAMDNSAKDPAMAPLDSSVTDVVVF